MKRRLVRIAGLIAFVLAFFLPAVSDRDRTNVYKGWQCAALTLGSVVHPLDGRSLSSFNVRQDDLINGILFTLDGWVNPLVVAYLILLMFRGLRRTRRVLTWAILVCMVDCWIVIGMGLVPLIGHFLWAGGILLILSPELLDSFQVQKATEPTSHKL
jgi:hypothetical protein